MPGVQKEDSVDMQTLQLCVYVSRQVLHVPSLFYGVMTNMSSFVQNGNIYAR
jgi:hypothetical protein